MRKVKWSFQQVPENLFKVLSKLGIEGNFLNSIKDSSEILQLIWKL